jgi:flagellar motility protein MotE (MotC chaperone)
MLGPESYKTAESLGILDTALQFAVPGYSRSGQLIRRLTDPRLENPGTAAAQALFNMFTGAKIENIDDQEKTRDALDKISEILADDPAVRNFESTYIPKELLPVVDERTRQLYQLDRQLRKERRQIQNVKPDRYNPLNY